MTTPELMVPLTRNQLLIILHALMSAQFPMDQESEAFKLYHKLKALL